MKVKIGNEIHNDAYEPIMIILTEQDKLNITNMSPDATKYCSFPDNLEEGTVENWMAETEGLEISYVPQD